MADTFATAAQLAAFEAWTAEHSEPPTLTARDAFVAGYHAGLASAWPAEITDELRDVLGFPNNQCWSLASSFRNAGLADIPPKAEAEQAYVLHWLVGMVLKHGANWRVFASKELDAVVAKAKELGARKGASA